MSAPLPGGTEVQSLIFDPDRFTSSEARAWARENGFRAGGVDLTANTIRIRQHDPGRFLPGTFRTIQLTDGVMAVVAVPKRQDRPREKPEATARKARPKKPADPLGDLLARFSRWRKKKR